MYKLSDIFDQANHRNEMAECKHERFCIKNGVKISYDIESKQYTIYNTTVGGDYYSEITQDEYDVFMNYGWMIGVANTQLHNYERKLENINQLIRSLVNKPNFSKKKYEEYKKTRTRYLNLYSKALNKLNKKLPKDDKIEH